MTVQQHVLNFLNERIQSLDSPLLAAEKRVFYPNENIPDDANDEDVYFEVFVGATAPEVETEQTTSYSCVASIVLNGRQNVGIAPLETIAESLTRMFSPVNPDRIKGFAVDENNVTTNIYIAKTEKTEGGNDAGRYKITVFITLDTFEERKE